MLHRAVTALGGARICGDVARIATEAAMVVFAVLAAFSIEAWREERQLRRFADMARAAVELEVETNLEEFRATRTSLRALLERIARVQQEA